MLPPLQRVWVAITESSELPCLTSNKLTFHREPSLVEMGLVKMFTSLTDLIKIYI